MSNTINLNDEDNDLDVKNAVEELSSFFPEFENESLFEGISSVPDVELSETQEDFLERKSKSGYQSPIKVSWTNLGDFSPNAATDKRHPTGHQGVDMQAPQGTSIYPLAPGIITRVDNTPKSGNCVNIEHDDGVTTFYAHCSSIKVKKGEKVDYDTVIATVGNTGNAKGTSPHLHFQVWVNGQITNPGNFFTVPKYQANKKASFSNEAKIIFKIASYYDKKVKFFGM